MLDEIDRLGEQLVGTELPESFPSTGLRNIYIYKINFQKKKNNNNKKKYQKTNNKLFPHSIQTLKQ